MKGALGLWLSGSLLLAAASGAGPDEAVQTPPELLRAAEAALVAQQYDRAIELYERLRGSYPGAPQIPYNMGVAAYRKGDLDQAEQLFDQALTLADDMALRARSAYNLGTTAYRKAMEQPASPDPTAPQGQTDAATRLDDAAEQLGQALQHYREAIDADPRDLDAKANGELAYRLLKQLEQMQEQMQQQSSQESSDDPPDEQNPQEHEPQEPGDNANDRQSPQPGQEDQEQPAGDPQEPPQEQQPAEARAGDEEPTEPPEAEPSGVMTREEAERLLQQVRDKERRRREDLARREASRHSPVEKDW